MKVVPEKITSLNVSSLKTRIAVPEIQVEWRELAEGSGLALLSIFLYVSGVLTELCFVPFMIIVIKRGWKEGLIFLSLSAAAFFTVMISGFGRIPLDGEFLLISPARYSFNYIEHVSGLKGGRYLDFFFVFGLFGIFLGYLVSRNYKLKYVVFFGLTVYIGIVVLPLAVSSMMGGLDRFLVQYTRFVDIKTTNYMELYLEQMRNTGSLMHVNNTDLGLEAKKLEFAVQMFKDNVIFGIAPRGGYLVKQLGIILFGIVLVRLYFKSRLDRAALRFSILEYRIGDGWVWGLIFSWFFVYINLHLKSGAFGIIGWNAAVVFSLLFFLRGLSIIRAGAERIRIPRIIQYGVLLFFLFYSFIFFVTITTGIGVADIWLRLRDTIDRTRRSDT